MKNPVRLFAIIAMIIGFILCVMDQFGIGVTLMSVGVFVAILAKPKSQPARRNPTPQKPPVTVPGAPAADAYAFHGTEEEYFYQLLRGCYPQMQVERNVSVSALTGGSHFSSSWSCQCGAANTGNFCAECGNPRPATAQWRCSCGARNTTKFCAECGANRPIGRDDLTFNDNSKRYCTLSFVLRQGGQPKLVILHCDKNSWDRVDIQNTMDACKKAGIPCLRFIESFRQRSDYVVDRINRALR